ncbi:hypothetical protein BOSE62_150372 [Bosea sp. 62]|nr:hypothetical protein BOSE46_10470 [Bosea sp. 46]CAD5250418.1 hypothetical protein BOSE21B_10685 [Bosea sp. 21B]CAD5264374.1 hypothetical protein BOSE7B_150450 [Bosea sp. 7B]VVT44183.1 hypothetical protein BOS5A_10386 [Bosea sp. EC-HK365B]VXB12011.1 hypothetical protein BOSE29B_10466 [Bosea sp. 29B]VXB80062.1 hypothetical protein BOSE62_150372 [Bosea sp. 62]VXC33936.1 hypothetical protein BOSE125_20149 [Bosea sp. 125]VXC42827.1 hypothetical protein BOSE127_190077 [Bosea sp. 127]
MNWILQIDSANFRNGRYKFLN